MSLSHDRSCEGPGLVMTQLGDENIATDHSPRNTPSFRLDLALLTFAVLVAIGSLGTWVSLIEGNAITFNFASVPYAGTSQTVDRVGWVTLSLGAVMIVAIASCLVRAPKAAYTTHVVGTSLFGATAVVSVVSVINLHLELAVLGIPANGHLETGIGWGLWLCLSASAAALAVGTAQCVALHRPPRVAE